MERQLTEIQSAINSILSVKSLIRKKKKKQADKKKELFTAIINSIHFGKEGAEVISWFLWERANPDGTHNYLMDEAGNEVHIDTVQDLWELLLRLNPKYNE